MVHYEQGFSSCAGMHKMCSHSVIDLRAAKSTNVLDLCTDTLRATEENERLVDEVCTKIVGLSVSGKR